LENWLRPFCKPIPLSGGMTMKKFSLMLVIGAVLAAPVYAQPSGATTNQTSDKRSIAFG